MGSAYRPAVPAAAAFRNGGSLPPLAIRSIAGATASDQLNHRNTNVPAFAFLAHRQDHYMRFLVKAAMFRRSNRLHYMSAPQRRICRKSLPKHSAVIVVRPLSCAAVIFRPILCAALVRGATNSELASFAR
jgi:hypothetical protein